jgi:3-oxoacyl-[acyl-carrier-protein] synthase-1
MGLNLGEGCATMILSVEPEHATSEPVRVLGGALSNDANHISGPSRTGAELSEAINRALDQSGLRAADVDFISAHGTATLYNDEMEAKAFDLAGLGAVPLNSLKGNFGHTPGRRRID